jgi:hypothetical protein
MLSLTSAKGEAMPINCSEPLNRNGHLAGQPAGNMPTARAATAPRPNKDNVFRSLNILSQNATIDRHGMTDHETRGWAT